MYEGEMGMKTLKDVRVGETVTVAKLHGEGPVKRRIMDMGVDTGQVLDHHVLAALQAALLLLHGDTGPVAHILAGAGERFSSVRWPPWVTPWS